MSVAADYFRIGFLTAHIDLLFLLYYILSYIGAFGEVDVDVVTYQVVLTSLADPQNRFLRCFSHFSVIISYCHNCLGWFELLPDL